MAPTENNTNSLTRAKTLSDNCTQHTEKGTRKPAETVTTASDPACQAKNPKKQAREGTKCCAFHASGKAYVTAVMEP